MAHHCGNLVIPSPAYFYSGFFPDLPLDSVIEYNPETEESHFRSKHRFTVELEDNPVQLSR